MNMRRRFSVKARMLATLMMTILILAGCQGNLDSIDSRETNAAIPSVSESESTRVVEETSENNTSHETSTTSVRIAKKNEIVAAHFETLMKESGAYVNYSNTPITSEDAASAIYMQNEEKTLSLNENSFGQLLFDDLFFTYDWHLEADASIKNDGFLIGTSDHFFYIALESDLVLLYDAGVSQYYRLEDRSFPNNSAEDDFPHSASLLHYYSDLSSSVYDLRLNPSSTAAIDIGHDLAEAYLSHLMDQESVNQYKISDYKIVDLAVSSDDEAAPTELIIDLKAIVVPEKDENTTYWFKGAGVELWPEDDNYKSQPLVFDRYNNPQCLLHIFNIYML